jgi:hypothetical protein
VSHAFLCKKAEALPHTWCSRALLYKGGSGYHCNVKGALPLLYHLSERSSMPKLLPFSIKQVIFGVCHGL